jgi:hypothetical protein
MKIATSSGAISFMVHIHHVHEHEKNKLPKSKTLVFMHAGTCSRDEQGRCTALGEVGESRVNYVVGDVFNRIEGATRAFKRAFEKGYANTLTRTERGELWKSFFDKLHRAAEAHTTQLEDFIADLAARWVADKAGVFLISDEVIAEVAQAYGITPERFDELVTRKKDKAA